MNEDIDFDFYIPFSTESEPDVSEITIYNLSRETVGKINKGMKIELNAGYEGSVGMICSGEVATHSTRMEGVERVTLLRTATAIIKWQEEKVSKTYGPGTSAETILRDLLQSFGITIADMSLAKGVTYSKGKTVSGRLKDVVKALARETESKFYMEKGRAYIRPFEMGTETGFVLSGTTGLLGSPEQVEIQEGEQKTKTGYKVQALLNHNIAADSIIFLESSLVKGTFRVVKGAHTSEWVTEMEVV